MKVLVVAGLCFVFSFGVIGCSDQTESDTDETYDPDISSEDYVEGIDNSYFGLESGKLYIYEGETEEGYEHIEVSIEDETKTIMDIECIVVRDTVYIDDELVEDTYDWYAQDTEGNVWYFGEDSKEYEDGEVVSSEGSWEAGVDGALPGILIEADPQAGDTYRQEYYEDVAEDMAEVVSIEENIVIEMGEYSNVLKTEEWNPLEDDSNEYKYYAKGVGLILEYPVDDQNQSIELVEIQ